MLLEHRECTCKELHVEALKKVQHTMQETVKLERMAELYKMFSDPNRLRILWVLESGKLCVCDLASLLDMSSSAISHHLKSLRQANLVTSRRVGKNIYYTLADNHLKDILLQSFRHINE